MAIGPRSQVVESFGSVAILKNSQGPFHLIMGPDPTAFVSSCICDSLFSVEMVAGFKYGGQVRLNGTVILDREAIIRVSTVPKTGLFRAPRRFLEYVNNNLTARGAGGVERVPGSRIFIVSNCTDEMISNLMPIDFVLLSINEFNSSDFVRY
jgi:hypothetical protein